MSTDADPRFAVGSATAPLDPACIERLFEVSPGLRIGRSRPAPSELAAAVGSWWVPGATVVYVGATKRSLTVRVAELARTPLGARGPHRAGWPMKLLGCPLYVHLVVVASDVHGHERRFLRRFAARHGSALALPFANLLGPDGRRKEPVIAGTSQAPPSDQSPRQFETSTPMASTMTSVDPSA